MVIKVKVKNSLFISTKFFPSFTWDTTFVTCFLSSHLYDVKHHGNADQGVDLQQGKGVEQPPNANHYQKFCVQLKTKCKWGDFRRWIVWKKALSSYWLDLEVLHAPVVDEMPGDSPLWSPVKIDTD